MGIINDVGQKIKGKAQQIKGEAESKNGNNGEGFVDKVKGKINETVADVKIDARKEEAKKQ